MHISSRIINGIMLGLTLVSTLRPPASRWHLLITWNSDILSAKSEEEPAWRQRSQFSHFFICHTLLANDSRTRV